MGVAYPTLDRIHQPDSISHDAWRDVPSQFDEISNSTSANLCNSLAPLARHLLEFTLSRAEQEKFSQPYTHNTLQPKNKCNQSNLNMSTLMPRASLQALGFLRPSLVASQSRCSRSFHQYVTPILLIGPNTRVRQRFEFFKLKTKFQPHAFAGGVRTIFIQTENTPNPDVSKGPYTTSISC